MHNEDLRIEALRQAVDLYGDTHPDLDADIVKTAEAFLAFLRGEVSLPATSLEQLMREGVSQ